VTGNADLLGRAHDAAASAVVAVDVQVVHCPLQTPSFPPGGQPQWPP
jgi:hypothetical protein